MATKIGPALAAIFFLASCGASYEDEIANIHMLEAKARFSRSNGQKIYEYPKDCSGVRGSSGIYVIQPSQSPPIVVYCDMTTDGGGWTMIQRNTKGSRITWNEYWTAYKYGFGNILKDHWLGNEYIYNIINQRDYKIMFRLKISIRTYYANYDSFSIGNEASGYQLHLGIFSGNATNAMMKYGIIHDNMRFSTIDRDQDLYSSNCATIYKGGFWFNNCYKVNLNSKSIYWHGIGSCKLSEILIKPTNFCLIKPTNLST